MMKRLSNLFNLSPFSKFVGDARWFSIVNRGRVEPAVLSIRNRNVCIQFIFFYYFLVFAILPTTSAKLFESVSPSDIIHTSQVLTAFVRMNGLWSLNVCMVALIGSWVCWMKLLMLKRMMSITFLRLLSMPVEFGEIGWGRRRENENPTSAEKVSKNCIQ